MSEDHLHFHRRAEDECPEKPIPAGLTEEQLDFFTEQTVRAVRKGVRSYRNSALVGFLGLLIGLIFAFSTSANRADSNREAIVKSGRAVAVEGCNRDYTDRKNFRELLERLKTATKDNKTSTLEQKRTAIAFYDAQLKKFTLPDCRTSEHLLTDDPNAEIPVIVPYYPGGEVQPNG